MINNNIEEDYCSFEVSKLLKKKGFYNGWLMTFFKNEELVHEERNTITRFCTEDEMSKSIIQAPTHSLAIKWIRENFGYYIQAGITYDRKGWSWMITNIERNPVTDYLTIPQTADLSEFNSPKAAIEAALLYTLQNLIP